MLACLAVPSRFRLVRAIAEADLCVGELAISVGLSQSCTTRHLQALERAGLVRGKREGRRVRFTLCQDADGARSILDLVLGGGGSRRPDAGRRCRDAARAEPAREADCRKDVRGREQAMPGTAAIGDPQRNRPALPTAEHGPASSRPPVRPFRRQDIEDYLL